MARTTSSALLLRRLPMATRAPSLAKANAVALPIPELPPVTSATLPVIKVRPLSCVPNARDEPRAKRVGSIPRFGVGGEDHHPVGLSDAKCEPGETADGDRFADVRGVVAECG